MLQGYTIKTTYHGPTNCRGSRVSAERMDAKPSTQKHERVTIAWDSALGSSENHLAAVRALLAKHGWTDEHTIIGGGGWDRGEVYLVVNVAYARGAFSGSVPF